jgi:hypothetical protein
MSNDYETPDGYDWRAAVTPELPMDIKYPPRP